MMVVNQLIRLRPTSMPEKSVRTPTPRLERVTHPSQRSILRLVWKELLSLILALILLVPIWSLVLLLLPLALFAGWCLDMFMTSGLKESYPGFRRVDPCDAVWLACTKPDTSPVSMVLLTVQRGLTFQEIKALVLDRMVLAKDDQDNIMYPRFMQKVVEVAGCFAWVFDGEFDPSKHIVVIPPEISSMEVLRAYMAELTFTPIATTCPPWMLHVRTNFGVNGDTILLYRFHQALSDGISLVKILCRSVTDKTQDVYHIKSRFGGIQFCLNTVRSVLMASVFLLSHVLFPAKADWTQPHNPFFLPKPAGFGEGLAGNKKPCRRRAVNNREIYWSDSVSLRVLDRISMVTRHSLHNIILTCLSGAVRSCLTAEGHRRLTPAHAAIPVDLRRPLSSITSAIEMGNQFAVLNLRIPTDTIGSIPRLWKIRQEEDKLKSTSDTTSMYWIMQILGHLLPVRLLRLLLTRSIISGCTVTNVPGPDAQLYLDGKAIKSIAFWPSSLVAQSSLSVSFFTYADKLQIGIAVDPDLCDGYSFASEFALEVKELSGLLLNRRAPGEVKWRHSDFQEPIQGLRSRILEVQHALQEAQMAVATAHTQKNIGVWSEESMRIDQLREELSSMLSTARRRKSVVEGVSMDFEDEEGMANEVRPGSMSRRRASSISSLESVRVFAVTPSRTPGSDRESISMSRSQTNSNMQGDSASSGHPTTAIKVGKLQNTHVIYITRDTDSADSSQQV